MQSMQSTRAFMLKVATRTIAVALLATFALVATQHVIAGLALLAGSLIGVAYLFHIAGTFNRLSKGKLKYLPLLTVESLLRVLLAGAAPLLIIGRGPWLAYLLYIAGFVAPLAVAILLYRQQISNDCVQPDAVET